MSATNFLAAAIVVVVLLLALLAIHEVRRKFREFREDRARIQRRIVEVRRMVASGVRHGDRSTLTTGAAPHGKATHVSTTGERDENRG